MLLAGLLLALAADVPGAPLAPWVQGSLDIYQIATGRGNSAFLQFPDGSTLLIDAGAAGELKYADPKPDASRRPGHGSRLTSTAFFPRMRRAGSTPRWSRTSMSITWSGSLT